MSGPSSRRASVLIVADRDDPSIRESNARGRVVPRSQQRERPDSNEIAGGEGLPLAMTDTGDTMSTTTDPISAHAPINPHLAVLEDAHGWTNSAYNAIVNFRAAPEVATADIARSSLASARDRIAVLAARDATDEATLAARLLMPRFERATDLLSHIGTVADEAHLRPLLSEFDAALDHIEQVLGAAGWD